MCLIVNSPKMIAETDLAVYKILEKDNNNFLTPYKKCSIQFENGQFFQVMDGEKVLDLDFIYIEKGIHAYYRENTAKEKNAILNEASSFLTFKVHYAVIPKGCEYCLGIEDEIVSTDMIIFETDEDYRKYKRKHKVKPVK